ncbi:glycerate kinase [Saliphagus sp. GCM10025334]
MNPHVSIEDYDALASSEPRAVALDCLVAGIDAAHPRRVVFDALALDDEHLTVSPVTGPSRTYDLEAFDDVVVLGGGNAAGHVAAALEALLGDRIDGGVVVTDDPVETDRIGVLPGDHPVPSERGLEGANAVLERAVDAGPDDLVLGCLTGGGSALLPAPANGLSLEDLRKTTEALLASGASIDEINAVRKHLSRLKGGNLARAAAPATVVGLLVSDVAGDDPSVIASGPLSPDSTTFADALDGLERYGIDAPESILEHLRRGTDGNERETPTDDDPAFDDVDCHVVANANTALEAGREVAVDRGYAPLVLSSSVRGEAREAAKTQVAIAEEIARTGTPVEPPAVVLSGGETTVTLADNHGRGGPNQEFVLGGALELAVPAVVASVDTDGIDGATDAAGAIADQRTVSRDGPLDPLKARRALDRNDAYPALEATNALIRTGATGTNVNDLRALVVERGVTER